MTMSYTDVKAYLRQIANGNFHETSRFLANLTMGADWSAAFGINATAAEINNAVDLSARAVDGSSSLTVTVADHASKTITLGGTGAAKTMTLPAATGSMAIFRFVVTAVNTSNHVINAATNSGAFYGQLMNIDRDLTAPKVYFASGTSSFDVITLNGTTTGGQIGDIVTVQDIAANTWSLFGTVQCPAGSDSATPFS